MKEEINIEKLSTALISDVLISMGYENQLLGKDFRPNFKEAKLFGSIRTSKLKKIGPNEDYKDIYKIINFIPQMAIGEVILVAGGFDNMAFFGELMSTLAVKNKLSGAIIDGVTRDVIDTIKLDFPVFAKGICPRDLKHKAIVESIDSEVIVDGVVINSGDHLFGDLDGVIIIPKGVLEECMDKCILLIKNEEKVKKLIKSGKKVDFISKECGDF